MPWSASSATPCRWSPGETDSERFFALITREIERTGEIGEGITAAARWVAGNLPLFAINLVLIDATDLWALRYPGTHELLVLQRAAGGAGGHRHLEHASARGSIRVRSGELIDRPAVVIATERMDEDAGWRALASGELLHGRRPAGDPPASWAPRRRTRSRSPTLTSAPAAPSVRRPHLPERDMSTSLIYRSPAIYELVMLALYRGEYRARLRVVAEHVPAGASVLELCPGPGALYQRHLRQRASPVHRGRRERALPRPPAA